VRKIEHVYPGGACREIEVEDSLHELAEELKKHLQEMIDEGREHGTNCACMDNLIRRIQNYIDCDTPPEIQSRMRYVLQKASRR
jgi:hypothetical protein